MRMHHIVRRQWITAVILCSNSSIVVGSSATTFTINSAHQQIELGQPLVIDYTIQNNSNEPVDLHLLPYESPVFDLMLATDGNAWTYVDVRLKWPEKPSSFSLTSNSSIIGTLLVIAGDNEGFVFKEQGTYNLRLSMPVNNSPVMSNTITIHVVPQSSQNREILDYLAQLYYTALIGDPALYPNHLKDKFWMLFAGRMAADIVSLDIPFEMNREGATTERGVTLLEGLNEFCERWPDSYYTGYVERFLGFAYVRAFEQTLGLASNYTSQLKEEQSYKLAHKHLSIAFDTENVWPKYETIKWLGLLAAVVGDDNELETYRSAATVQYGRLSSGVALANEMNEAREDFERDMARYGNSE